MSNAQQCRRICMYSDSIVFNTIKRIQTVLCSFSIWEQRRGKVRSCSKTFRHGKKRRDVGNDIPLRIHTYKITYEFWHVYNQATELYTANSSRQAIYTKWKCNKVLTSFLSLVKNARLWQCYSFFLSTHKHTHEQNTHTHTPYSYLFKICLFARVLHLHKEAKNMLDLSFQTSGKFIQEKRIMLGL